MGSDWQPIETAPRDETTRIIAFNGVRVGEAETYLDYSEENDFLGGYVWRWANDSCGCCWSDANPQPTHWQPLPPPPALNQEDDRGAGREIEP